MRVSAKSVEANELLMLQKHPLRQLSFTEQRKKSVNEEFFFSIEEDEMEETDGLEELEVDSSSNQMDWGNESTTETPQSNPSNVWTPPTWSGTTNNGGSGSHSSTSNQPKKPITEKPEEPEETGKPNEPPKTNIDPPEDSKTDPETDEENEGTIPEIPDSIPKPDPKPEPETDSDQGTPPDDIDEGNNESTNDQSSQGDE